MPGTWPRPSSAISKSSRPSICPSIDPSSMPSFTSSRPSPPTRSTRSSPSATFSPAITSKQQSENPLSGLITLGVVDLDRSRRFYVDGFGWSPVFENEEIIFYQMNGLMLGTWLQSALEGDMQRSGLSRPGAFALAHNVPTEGDVQIVIERLTAAG